MARQHAVVLTTIWSDPDWRALSQGAQRLFLLLLSQPKLSMVGLLDCLPSRWARLAADTTVADIDAALDELEASRFVVVDRDTDEVLIRTFVRHECTAAKAANPRWLTGVWRAWEGIESRKLREAALAEIPSAVWDSDKVEPPAEAQKFLAETSGRNFCQNVPAETSGGTSRQNVPAETSAAGEASAEAQNSRSAQKLPAERSARNFCQNVPAETSARNFPTNHEPTDNKSSSDSRRCAGTRDDEVPSQLNPTVGAAVAVLARHDLEQRQTAPDQPPVADPAAWERRAYQRRMEAHRGALEAFLAEDPTLTPEKLAERVLGPSRRQSGAVNGHAAANGHNDPLAGIQAAARARAERHLRVIHGQACTACHDTGWRLDPDSNAAVPCPHQPAQEAQ